MRSFIFSLFLLCMLSSLTAQSTFKNIQQTHENNSYPELERIEKKYMPDNSRSATLPSIDFTKKSLGAMELAERGMKVNAWHQNGLPAMIEGDPNIHSDQYKEYLIQCKEGMRIQDPEEEFVVHARLQDDLNMEHIKLLQQYKGLEVYGGEIIVHAKDDMIQSVNGYYYPSPNIESIVPVIKEDQVDQLAIDLVEYHPIKEDVLQKLNMKQIEKKLVIYHVDKKLDGERLAWHILIYPNVIDRWEIFVDATNGEILEQRQAICKFHAVGDLDLGSTTETCSHNHREEKVEFDPTTANAADLFNTLRLINVYEQSGTYFLLDASRSMFNSNESNLPDDPVGAIWTIDANNTNPNANNFNVSHVTSNNNSWLSKNTGVSAHYNAGLSYEYFKNTFNRNSINNMGGNIVSLINVVDDDGNQMDNAFWNGAAMFYGNGNTAFEPLARALDVAGHEISHGVVQATANLEYQGESGAMNESFADIFGAMIDRDDWRMGETVARTNVFPTGALRDLSDPHNGGNGIQDVQQGWQPRHYNERFTGSQDNGGVHINSGIPNYAFYKFATAAGMDKSKAEQIFYRALTNYLTKSSQFRNLRTAVVQSAKDLHGDNSLEVQAANAAFDEVGIGASQTSSGNGEQDLQVNPGSDLLIMADEDRDVLKILDQNASVLSNPFTMSNAISKPSVRDNGDEIVFVADDNNIHYIYFDGGSQSFQEAIILNDFNGEGFWRNVIISRDGARVAAISKTLDNKLYVFDYSTSQVQVKEFELMNPTFTQGVTTGNVEFADAMEFDHAGEWVMYDALNKLNSNNGTDIEYWDISFVNVWDRSSGSFAEGRTSKLFNQLPENVSVGNPTFAENSTYIIAFDYLTEGFFGTDYEVRAANIERGTVNTIVMNSILSYPNYSRQDNQMLFDAMDNNSQRVVAIVPLGADKMTAAGDALIFENDARWAEWFANGDRNLYVGNEDLVNQYGLNVYPNPFKDKFQFELEVEKPETLQYSIYDMIGNLMFTEQRIIGTGHHLEEFKLSSLASGEYILKIRLSEGSASLPIFKID